MEIIIIAIILYFIAPIIRPGVKSIPIIGDIIDLMTVFHPVALFHDFKRWKKSKESVIERDNKINSEVRKKSFYTNNDSVKETLSKEIKCPICGKYLELEETERIERKFVCPVCNKIIDMRISKTHKSKECPNCGLINPDTSMQCDCGYKFHQNND